MNISTAMNPRPAICTLDGDLPRAVGERWVRGPLRDMLREELIASLAAGSQHHSALSRAQEEYILGCSSYLERIGYLPPPSAVPMQLLTIPRSALKEMCANYEPACRVLTSRVEEIVRSFRHAGFDIVGVVDGEWSQLYVSPTCGILVARRVSSSEMPTKP